jgi:hypothetical protein
VSVLCEARESAALRALGAGFWDEESGIEDVLPEEHVTDDGDEAQQQWEQEAVALLSGLDAVTVEEGYVSSELLFNYDC